MAEKTDNQTVAKFYDRFALQQIKTGVNIRHRTILRNLKRAGLQRNSHVLEIGCGIGILTGFIGNYCRSGSVQAVDISPESIEIARHRTSHLRHVKFIVSDMHDFSMAEKFDFIVLPDVLEHIPLENHKKLFKTIRDHMHLKSIVAINIPDPYCLEWFWQNEPEKLQIIDQSLYTNILLENIYANGLFLESLSRYSLHSKEADYQWILLKPRVEVTTLHFKSTWQLKWQSLVSRIFY